MLYHLVKATYFSKLNNQSIPNFYATKKEKKKAYIVIENNHSPKPVHTATI
jgi:hypothetical protein